MIMIVKTPGSQMGSPAAAEEGGEEMGDEKCESGERSEVQARSTVASMVPKARSRSREVVTLNEKPRISLRVSTKLPSSPSSSMSTVIIALARTSACLSTTAAFARTLASSLTPFQVGESASTVDIDRDKSTGRLKSNRPLDDTCGNFQKSRDFLGALSGGFTFHGSFAKRAVQICKPRRFHRTEEISNNFSVS